MNDFTQFYQEFYKYEDIMNEEDKTLLENSYKTFLFYDERLELYKLDLESQNNAIKERKSAYNKIIEIFKKYENEDQDTVVNLVINSVITTIKKMKYNTAHVNILINEILNGEFDHITRDQGYRSLLIQTGKEKIIESLLKFSNSNDIEVTKHVLINEIKRNYV